MSHKYVPEQKVKRQIQLLPREDISLIVSLTQKKDKVERVNVFKFVYTHLVHTYLFECVYMCVCMYCDFLLDIWITKHHLSFPITMLACKLKINTNSVFNIV